MPFPMPRTRESGNQAMQEVQQFRKVYELADNRYPLVQMLSGSANTFYAETTKIEYAEDVPLNTAATVDAHAAGAGTLTIQNSNIGNFLIGQTIRLVNSSSGAYERARVATIDYTAGTLTYENLGDTAVAQAAGDPVYIYGTEVPEAGSSLNAIDSDYTDKYTFVQEFSTSLENSMRQTSMPGVPGSSIVEQKARKLARHRGDHERTLIYGNRHTMTDSDNKKHYYTQGILGEVTTNILDRGGSTLSYDDYVAFYENLVKSGENMDRLAVCGSTMIRTFQYWIKTYISTTMEATVFGYKVLRILTPFGDTYVMHHPTLDLNGDSDKALILDMDQILIGVHKTTKFVDNLQSQKDRLVFGEYQSMLAYIIRHEFLHGVVKGVTGGA